MGIECVVVGYIECPGFGDYAIEKRIYRHNMRVLRRLPDDDEWPFLSRHIFSAPLMRRPQRPSEAYGFSQLIHFAASYKNMLLLDAEWAIKFERLLNQLCWSHAVVLEGFNRRRHEWNVGVEYQEWRLDPPRPPSSWTVQSFETQKESIASREAFDGILCSKYQIGPAASGGMNIAPTSCDAPATKNWWRWVSELLLPSESGGRN